MPGLLVLVAEWLLRDLAQDEFRATGGVLACAIALLLGYLASRPLFRTLEGMRREANRRSQEAASLRAQLVERERLSRDLHDSLAQMAAFLHLRVETAVALLDEARTNEAMAELKKASQESDVVYTQIRDCIDDLRRPLQESEAGSSLLELLTQLAESHDLAITAENPQLLDMLVPEQARQLSFICREALANTLKHAAANQVHLTVKRTGHNALSLTIADDGRGFETPKSAHAKRTGLGLESMRKRALSLGGECIVRSRPGAGTVVTVRLPLPRQSVDAATC